MATQIETVSDMMRTLQDEIEAVKSGTMAETTARVVAKFRTLQLKLAELQLQYTRMTRSKSGELRLLISGNGKKSDDGEGGAAPATA